LNSRTVTNRCFHRNFKFHSLGSLVNAHDDDLDRCRQAIPRNPDDGLPTWSRVEALALGVWPVDGWRIEEAVELCGT
jgi:hypothetical protein